MSWDPGQYERFKAERAAPFRDLAALVTRRPGMRVVDLGCGTGELTRELHLALGAAETVGIDTSAEMLAKAPSAPGLRFELGDIAEFDAEGGFDLVFSNAALHWLPDHERLLGRLVRSLKPGGQLAVQVPANHEHPSHVLAHAIAAEAPFLDALDGYRREISVLPPERYAELLYRLGLVERRVRLEVYAHELPDRDAVVEWLKGTTLTDYQGRLDPAMWALYLVRYTERLREVLPDDRPFLFTYPRIFVTAKTL